MENPTSADAWCVVVKRTSSSMHTDMTRQNCQRAGTCKLLQPGVCMTWFAFAAHNNAADRAYLHLGLPYRVLHATSTQSRCHAIPSQRAGGTSCSMRTHCYSANPMVARAAHQTLEVLVPAQPLQVQEVVQEACRCSTSSAGPQSWCSAPRAGRARRTYKSGWAMQSTNGKCCAAEVGCTAGRSDSGIQCCRVHLHVPCSAMQSV